MVGFIRRIKANIQIGTQTPYQLFPSLAKSPGVRIVGSSLVMNFVEILSAIIFFKVMALGAFSGKRLGATTREENYSRQTLGNSDKRVKKKKSKKER